MVPLILAIVGGVLGALLGDFEAQGLGAALGYTIGKQLE